MADTLLRLVAELPRYGVRSFRFKDLADPLRTDARQRWAACLAEDRAVPTAMADGGEGWALRQEVPECTFESHHNYLHLVSCVSAAIGSIETDLRTRGYLRALWDHLRLSDDDGAYGACDDVAPVERRALFHRQAVEDEKPHRVVLALPFVQKVLDVEVDQAVDIGLGRELAAERVVPVREDVCPAVADQFAQGALLRPPLAPEVRHGISHRRFGVPALVAVHAQVAGRAAPQAAPLELAPNAVWRLFQASWKSSRSGVSPPFWLRRKAVKADCMSPPAVDARRPAGSPPAVIVGTLRIMARVSVAFRALHCAIPRCRGQNAAHKLLTAGIAALAAPALLATPELTRRMPTRHKNQPTSEAGLLVAPDQYANLLLNGPYVLTPLPSPDTRTLLRSSWPS